MIDVKRRTRMGDIVAVPNTPTVDAARCSDARQRTALHLAQRTRWADAGRAAVFQGTEGGGDDGAERGGTLGLRWNDNRARNYGISKVTRS